MENKINRKLCEFFMNYKKHLGAHSLELKRKILELCQEENVSDDKKSKINDIILNYIMLIQNYKTLTLSGSDFTQRKRVKSVVPSYERCIAKRADGEQCTRRKKEKGHFCGTHLKGTPHGTINNESSEELNLEKISVEICDINGILYYIDNNKNVYNSEDIMSNKTNPRVIAKYEKTITNDGNIKYEIPEFDN